jgi:hypothetical protein
MEDLHTRAMRQAQMTADDYMRGAINYIDGQLGEGYAKKHPELIGAFMRTCAADYDTVLLSTALGEDIVHALRLISRALELLDTSG